LRKLSVVIPALNEEEAIERVVQAIPKNLLYEMGFEVQILVVDNGSEDRTGELARKGGAEVVFEPARGYGRAYKTGFDRAQGQIIATADADMTYPVEDIPRLVAILEKDDLDFITTNRFTHLGQDVMSFRNKLGNGILNVTTRILFSIDLRDSQSGMWVFRKDLLGRMKLKSDGMAFSEEIKIEACHFAKCCWRELPIEYRPRVGRVKLRGWWHGFGNLFHLIKKRIVR
jgi:hypothetical protein